MCVCVCFTPLPLLRNSSVKCILFQKRESWVNTIFRFFFVGVCNALAITLIRPHNALDSQHYSYRQLLLQLWGEVKGIHYVPLPVHPTLYDRRAKNYPRRYKDGAAEQVDDQPSHWGSKEQLILQSRFLRTPTCSTGKQLPHVSHLIISEIF